MKDGVGRLLLTSELTQDGTVTSEAVRRTAFVIDRMHALTAWHCARDARDVADCLWLRLADPCYTGINIIDVPVVVIETDTALDAAVLALDQTRGAHGTPNDDLESLFNSIALPLGKAVPVHATIRTEGFPRDARIGGLAFAGSVVDCDAKLSRSRALQLHLAELGATVPHGPGGHSGGPVLYLDPDSKIEVVVGLVRSFPPDGSHKYAIGGTVLAARVQDLAERFGAVKDAQSRLQLSLPSMRRQHVPTTVDRGFAPDVWERYKSQLVAATGNPNIDSLFVRRDHQEISFLKAALNARIHDTNDRILHKAAELVTALVDALNAKDALKGVEVEDVPLGRLQRIYYQELGDWPRHGTSYDSMLIEAALVAISRRRRKRVDSLSPLARLILSVVFECEGEQGLKNEALITWLKTSGHQIADARQHFDLRSRTGIAWLLIDLGPERADSDLIEEGKRWPSAYDLSATLFMQGVEPIFLHHADDGYEPTEISLFKWLQEIIRCACELCDAEHDLVVDIAAPHDLLDLGIEQWCLIDVDGTYEPLAEHCQPRLRWSQRQRIPILRRAALKRARNVVWANEPAVLSLEASRDKYEFKRWLFNTRYNPWLLCGESGILSTDLLKMLLQEGCPYIVSYKNRLSSVQMNNLTTTVSRVPAAARKSVLPEMIRQESPTTSPPLIVWDDPMGRECYVLGGTRLRGPGG